MKKEKSRGKRDMIASVQKAIKILNVISEYGSNPIPLWKISERTGISKPTCSHIIKTLLYEGYLVKISPTKGYVLGPDVYCLSAVDKYGSELIHTCRPVMQYLYKTLGHCVVLAVIEGNTKYIIDYIDDGNIFEQRSRIRRDDIYRTATGRVILENMSPDELASIWQKYGAPSLDEWEEIRSHEDLLNYCRCADGDVRVTRTVGKTENVNLGYAIAIKSKVKCVGAIGIALKVSKDGEKKFIAEEEKTIKSLLRKASHVISKRL